MSHVHHLWKMGGERQSGRVSMVVYGILCSIETYSEGGQSWQVPAV